MEKLKIFAPVVLRIGIALVFIWFGTNQFIDTNQWVGYVPDYVINLSHLSAVTLVHFNGVFEIVFGVALLLGFFTRLSALLLAIHIIDIMFIVGYDSTGVRDFGLSIATVAIWFNGADWLTLDKFMKDESTSA